MSDESELDGWIERATTGDGAAVEDLLGHYLPDLRAYVVHHAAARVLAHEEGSDLAQSICREVLERLRDGRFAFRGEPQFRAWLYRAALMKLLTRDRFWRAARRDAPAPPSSPAEPAAPGTPSQDARLAEELERFESAVRQLPESHRQILALHHFEGLSHTEIAHRLAITPSTSRSLLARALARLATLGVAALEG